VERDHFEDLDVDERTVLKWIFKTCDGMQWIKLIWLRIGVGGGFL